MIPWHYKGEAVKAHPQGAMSFVYYMAFADGTFYWGKKNLQSVRRKKVVGKIRKVITITESNWKKYLSSSTEVKEKIKQGDVLVKRDIIRFCNSNAEGTYFELYYQVLNHCLLDLKCLNKWLSVKLYRPKEPYDLDL